MNILVTTVLDSTDKVEQLISLINVTSDIFANTPEQYYAFRKKYKLEPIDECWIITLNNKYDELKKFSAKTGTLIKVFRCSSTVGLNTEEGIKQFKSVIYDTVLRAKEHSKRLYLSSVEGTVYGDMQEAARIFGCAYFIYINNSNIPLMIQKNIPSSLIISGDEDKIDSTNFNINSILAEKESTDSFRIYDVQDNNRLLDELEIRNKQAIHLYGNFYGMVKSSRKEREIFRKLYYLPQTILDKIKSYKLGECKEKDLWIIQHLPKAELHSHIGGLLLPEELIEVALKAKNYEQNPNNDVSVKFYNNIQKILEYQDNPKDLENEIYRGVKTHFKGIGINPYQALGDYQGSKILLLKETLEATLDTYANHLLRENIKYVEIRCSPYNYTKLGMTIDEVVMCIINTLDKYKNSFDYRLIYILSRQASDERIEEAVKEYCRLYDTNLRFKEKFVGVDVAGDEEYRRPSELRNLFMPLLRRCAKVTIHAGETDNVESIWEAVYHLNTDRIGHGLKLLDNEELFKRFIDKKIGIEMCPSSNFQIIGYDEGEYPLLEYMQEGLRVTINTDDCGISLTNLTNEFLKAAEMCPGLTLWDCIVLIRNSLCIAFCDEKTREKLMHTYEDEMLEFFNDIFGE